jgi:hypothetical protein
MEGFPTKGMTKMQEYIVNLHIHTPYSDGTGSHEEIAMAAIRAEIDVVIVTDHNIWVKGPEGYYQEGEKKVLLLIGEEVHDRTQIPQKNHLLIIGAEREMAPFAPDHQNLIDKAHDFGALTFIAHPFEQESRSFNEPDISWVDWNVQGFTGIELWNAMSEFKSLLKGKLKAIYYAYNPKTIGHGPFPAALKKWDEMTDSGQRVVAVGGSDAHAMKGNLGPLKRILFPYEFHFQAVNTHILTEEVLSGNYHKDRKTVLNALRNGHAFVGYDLPESTSGFRFHAQGMGNYVLMGDEINLGHGITLQIHLPQRAECHLIRNGEIIQTWMDREVISYSSLDRGVYRVEVYINYRRKRRGWIFSNPIYVR